MTTQAPLSPPQREIATALEETLGKRTIGRAVMGSSTVLFVASMAFLVGIWYALLLVFPPYVLPAPHVVVAQIIDRIDLILAHAWVTTQVILAGFALAVAVGFPLGMIIAFSRIMDRLLYPPLIVSQAVPKVALAPVFLAWFGFGFQTNVAISFLIAVFPVIINTTLGLKSLEPEMVRLGRAMGSSPMRLFMKIRLPAALPSIFAGLKIAITFAVIGAVVGEFVASSAGLGYTIQVATGFFNLGLAFAAIVAISVLGVAAFFAIELIERVVLRSHPIEQRQKSA